MSRELLELAAKAAGYGEVWYLNDVAYIGPRYQPGQPIKYKTFNPIDDDGDALRLVVTLGLTIDMVELSVWHKGKCVAAMPAEGDHYAATRLAITRAAAAIGEKL